MTEKVSAVTSKNYYTKAKAFIEANPDYGYGVAIDPEMHPQQWGAWLDYFAKIGKRGSIAFMNTRAAEFRMWSREKKENDCCYQVPASMPSDFDADREWVYDKRAGDVFMDERARIKAKPELSEEAKQAVVKRVMKSTHLNRNLDWGPGQ